MRRAPAPAPTRFAHGRRPTLPQRRAEDPRSPPSAGRRPPVAAAARRPCPPSAAPLLVNPDRSPPYDKPVPATTPRAARPARGEELELRVESLAQGGRGVARREDGFVVFVAGALPGDLVRARVSRSKRGYAEAAAVD